jgi:general secretion pathway protein C
MPTALATGGMTLRGLMVRPGAAASAIIEMSDGRQRLVRAGSGLGNDQRVESIDAGGVVISGPGGQQMLAMPDSPARAGSATASRAFSAPLTALAATANDYRLAMKPRKAGGQTTGFIVTDVARLPALRMAGMMPGDVLISVNGSGIISEEKLMEMPAEIAGAYAVDVVFERAGQQRRAVVKIER